MKRILILCICLVLTLTTSYSFASEELENGTYTIQNQTHHENPVGVAMSSKYLERNTLIEKTDEGTFVTLEFNNTNYMGEFSVKVNGEEVSHEIVYHNEETNHKKIKFIMNDIDAELKIGMYVGPMDRDVAFGVSFDQETLKSPNEEESEGSKEQPAETNEQEIIEEQPVDKDEQPGEAKEPETAEKESNEANEPEKVKEQGREIKEPEAAEEQSVKEIIPKAQSSHEKETINEESKAVFQADENISNKNDDLSTLAGIGVIIIGLILLLKNKRIR
ncbi:MAG: NEAT domain-containing protein [Clostridia bacterium]|nr:NEAT domain-containing protein [Clostridia bacterium]